VQAALPREEQNCSNKNLPRCNESRKAIAMQDEGGNIAANDLIFHTEQFTQVFVNHMKNFHFMTSHLAHNAMEYDAMISLFNFLPADKRNSSFRSMMQSD
jgi:hypothetical protein